MPRDTKEGGMCALGSNFTSGLRAKRDAHMEMPAWAQAVIDMVIGAMALGLALAVAAGLVLLVKYQVWHVPAFLAAGWFAGRLIRSCWTSRQ